MKIKCLGAAGNVTGSRFLVETKKSRLLIDCGLYQEREFRGRNFEKFPVEPSGIDHVLLTHAHLDHCGYLPKLIKEGFKGKIFCTPPTSEIAKIVLMDSAHIQENDAYFKKYRHKKEKRKGAYPEIPLYTVEDAEKVPKHFKTIPYEKEVSVTSGVKAVFHDAGHILGSAHIELRVREEKEKICVFSGDIGSWNRPILRDPTIINKADYVFMESTYGNRIHENMVKGSTKLGGIIRDTYKRGGNTIIPAFSIERAQELLYSLSRLLSEDKIPHLLTFMDSPMAINVTDIFRKYPGYFDTEAKALLKKGEALFSFPLLKNTRSTPESKAINHIKGSVIVMAGSGMCTGGRIKHHLVQNIVNPENTILFVGYQAYGTLGREILERPKIVRIFGKMFPVRARIEKINSFSAHADKNDLLKWAKGFKGTPKKIFVIHGEKEPSEMFADNLKKNLKSEIIVPEYMREYIL